MVPCPNDILSGNQQQAFAAFSTSFIVAAFLLRPRPCTGASAVRPVLHRRMLRLAHVKDPSTYLAVSENLVLGSGGAKASRFTALPRRLLAFGKGRRQNAESSSGWKGLPHLPIHHEPPWDGTYPTALRRAVQGSPRDCPAGKLSVICQAGYPGCVRMSTK